MMTQVVPETPLLVDARTAAKLLNVSQRTLYSLLQQGQIPSVKLQGRRLFSVPALSKWIEERLSTDPPIPRRRKKARGQQTK